MMVVMVVKGLFRCFSTTVICPNRMSHSLIKSLRYLSRFYRRSVHSSAKVVSIPGNHGNLDKLEEFSFKEYIEKNNNFRSPVSEIINLNFSLDSGHKSLKLLVELKENLQNDCLWQEMLDCLRREVNTFNVEDFLKVIALASKVGINNDCQFFQDFITSLDNELKVRALKMDDILEILFVLRHTMFLRKSLKYFRFYLKWLRSLKKLHKFQPLQVTHILYYLEEFSDCGKSLYQYPLLKYLRENLSQFKVNEMGVILAALFKAKVSTSDVRFIRCITEKLLNEIENVFSIHLFYASKFLLSCSSFYHSEVILDFQEKLIPHISKFNAASLIHALGSGYPYSLNLSFWNNVVERLKEELKRLPVMDLMKLTRITTVFEVKNEEFLKLVVEAVEKKPNLEKCFPHFVIFCKHLAILGIYPEKLLDIVFSKDYIDNMMSRSFAREIAAWGFLNYTLQIDKPEYQCTYLNEFLEKKVMQKLLICKMGKNYAITPFSIRIKLRECLNTIFGDGEVLESFNLPHFERGVIMRFDENLNATVIPEEFKIRSKKQMKAPSDQHFWLCMNVAFIPPEGLNPIQKTYMRHLTAYGYKPVLVKNQEFHHYRHLGTEELQKYLKDVIQRALEEILQEKQKQKEACK